MKKMNLCTHVVGSLFAASLTATAASVETWTGGDKSAYQDEDGKALTSFDVADFWNGGVAPVNGQTAAYAFVIGADGDYAKHISNNAQHFIQSDLTIGGADNPNVTLEFVSTRPVVAGQPDNSSPACLRTGGTISLLGNNTTVKIGRGFLFGTRGDLKPSVNTFVIDPGVKFEGEGILNWGGTHLLVAAHDYGSLWLQLGQENGNDIEYTALGDITTKGRLALIQGGSGGIGGRSVLKLAGHTVTVGEVALGTPDNRPEDGNQSSFGGISFEGGALKVAGDILFIGDPDGVKADQSPLPREHRITTDQMGGTLEVGGSIVYRSKSDDGWYLRDLALVLNGDGTEQELELLTEDVGDTALCLYKNTVYGSVTVKGGAAVRLVDTFDNDRRTPGKAEALYTLDLTVEEGATLDLNGQSLYVYNEPTLAGEVLNGTVIRLRKAGFFSTVEYTLGTPGEALTGALGHWVGPMVAGDFDNDGKPELALVTMDENPVVAGSEFHLLDFDGTTLTEQPNFPISDTTVLPGRTQNLLSGASGGSPMVNPFMFEDLGDGKGKRLIYTTSGYSDVIAIAPDGTSAETLEPACSYGNDNFVLVDLDGDGVKDIVTCYRNTGNLRAYSVAKKTELWGQTLAADAGIVVRVGVADLNGDRKPEVLAVAKCLDTEAVPVQGLSIFKADGTAYVSPSGTEFASVPLPYGRGEGGGALIAKDVTGDGVPEIFIVDTNTKVGSTYGYLLVLDQDGQTLFWTQATEAPNKYSSPNVQFFDMDGDRICEFLYDGRIYNGKFEEIDRLPVPAECLGVCVRLSPALVDMTGDQVPEIVYGCRDKAWNDYDNARWIAAYDPVKKELLTGFPIKLQYSQDTGANDWHAGSCAHWNFANLIVADFDGDNKWEIVVGIGAVAADTAKRAALNVIKTPYGYEVKGSRTQEKIGAWQYGRGPLMDFTYPLARKEGFAIFVR